MKLSFSSVLIIIALVIVVYTMSDVLLLYVGCTLPMSSVVVLTHMYVKPLQEIRCGVGETFLNLHPSSYGVYVCQAFRPQRIMCWHGDVGKTLVIRRGVYGGAQFTITAGRMFAYTIDPEFIPVVGGEPRRWVKQLISDLKQVSKLPGANAGLLEDLLTNMTVEEEKEEDSGSLVVTTTGRRHLRVEDIQELDKVWVDIKRAMQMIYDMTGTTPYAQ